MPGHPEHDNNDTGIGEAVAEHQRSQEVLGGGEEAADDFAGARGALLQLADLPFAEGKEGGFRQRKEETGAGERDECRYCKNWPHWLLKVNCTGLTVPNWVVADKRKGMGALRRAHLATTATRFAPLRGVSSLSSTHLWRRGPGRGGSVSR